METTFLQIIHNRMISKKRVFTVISGLFFLLGISLKFLAFEDIFYRAFIVLAILSGGYFVCLAALRGLLRKKLLNIDFLVVIAVIGALYINQLLEAAAVVFFFSLSEALEEFGIERSRKALKKLIDKSPKKALLKSGKLVPVEKVRIKEHIIARPGDIISLDGIITKGYSSVDEATITGESIPNSKIVGDTVLAGTTNLNGYLEIEVTKSAKDSMFSKIIALVEKAQKSRAPVQKFIDSFARYYTPSIIIAAILIAFLPPLFLNDVFTEWLYRGLVLLVIACPCALVVSTPVSIASAVGRASQAGVLIKGGKYLELLGKSNVVALDKTKTLTLGKPQVSDIIPFEGSSEDEILADAAGVELHSSHPLSKSIVDFAKERGVSFHKMKDYEYVVGKGGIASCFVCKDINRIGNIKLIRPQARITKEVTQVIERLEKEGKTTVLVSEGDTVIGALGIADQIRPNAKKTVKKLHAMGIDSVILTGDSWNVGSYVGKQLGIKKIYASLLPDKKEEKIAELKRKYNIVIMVGDGINDAPSLAAASVGIAMGIDGSDVAIETADVILMGSNLLNIPFAIDLGRKTLQTIRFNISISIGSKFIFLILALMGLAHLEYAVGSDVGVAFIVVLNSLRLFRLKTNDVLK